MCVTLLALARIITNTKEIDKQHFRAYTKGLIKEHYIPASHNKHQVPVYLCVVCTSEVSVRYMLSLSNLNLRL